jgi:hypothetical protein
MAGPNAPLLGDRKTAAASQTSPSEAGRQKRWLVALAAFLAVLGATAAFVWLVFESAYLVGIAVLSVSALVILADSLRLALAGSEQPSLPPQADADQLLDTIRTRAEETLAEIRAEAGELTASKQRLVSLEADADRLLDTTRRRAEETLAEIRAQAGDLRTPLMQDAKEQAARTTAAAPGPEPEAHNGERDPEPRLQLRSAETVEGPVRTAPLARARTTNDVETCEIEWSRGRVHSEFHARAKRPDGSEYVAAISPGFGRHWRGRRATQEDRDAARTAYAALVEQLTREGWERSGAAPAWYAGRFRRRLPAPGDR